MVASTVALGPMVNVPPSEGPRAIHTPGLRADHSESILSTFAWCKKNIGSNPVEEMSDRVEMSAFG